MIKTIDYKDSKQVMLVATIPPLEKQEDCAFKDSLGYKMTYIQFSLGYMKPYFLKKKTKTSPSTKFIQLFQKQKQLLKIVDFVYITYVL